MDIRRLRAFLAVAEELHFTRAAARLGIAQPPLSQQIKGLEQQLGVQLFERATRGVQLTPAGAAFRPHAEAALAAVAAAASAATRAANGDAGSIRIGFTNSGSFNPVVTSNIANFRDRFPQVKVELAEQPTSLLIEALQTKRLDLAFLRMDRVDNAGLSLIPLASERLHIVLPQKHIAVRTRRIALADLSDQPFVLFPRANGPLLYDLLILACTRAGFVPNIVQEAPQLSSAMSLTAAGIGLTLVPESMTQLHASAIAHFPVADKKATVPLSIATQKTKPHPAVLNFLRLIGDQ